MDIMERLEMMAMTADDWAFLAIVKDSATYRKTMLMYEEGEFANLPRCGRELSVCCKCVCGRCVSRTGCHLRKEVCHG